MLAVWDVMVEQIMGTAGGKRRKRGSTSQNANSVIMTGGFSDSPALRSFLKGKLAQFNEQHGLAIELQWAPQFVYRSLRKYLAILMTNRNRSVLGTALGTLARAENVDSGPLRVPRLSIGLLRDHEHQGKDMYQVVKQFPELMPIEKQKKRRKLDPVVGRHYVEDVIEWIIKVVSQRTLLIVPHTYHQHRAKDLFRESTNPTITRPSTTSGQKMIDGSKRSPYMCQVLVLRVTGGLIIPRTRASYITNRHLSLR